MQGGRWLWRHQVESDPPCEGTHSLPPPTHSHTLHINPRTSVTVTAPIRRLPSFHCVPGPSGAYASSWASPLPKHNFPTRITRRSQTAVRFRGGRRRPAFGPGQSGRICASVWSTGGKLAALNQSQMLQTCPTQETKNSHSAFYNSV